MDDSVYEVDTSDERITRLATQVLSGEVGLIEASQELSEIGLAIDWLSHGSCFVSHPEDFKVFGDIVSEVGTRNPTGEWRKYWNREVLAKIDELQKQVEDKYQATAIAACHALLAKYK